MKQNPQVKPINLAPSEDRYVPDTVESFRPGALDYRDHPSRIGDTLVPYKAAKALTSNVKKAILGIQP